MRVRGRVRGYAAGSVRRYEHSGRLSGTADYAHAGQRRPRQGRGELREERPRSAAELLGAPPQTPCRLFWAYTLNLAVAYGGYFGYLAASPLIFEKMGLATETTSYCYITVSIAYVAGNLTSRALARKRPVNQLLWVGHGFFLLGALMMLGLGLSGAGAPWGLLVLVFMPVMTYGNGFLLPLSMSAGVTTFRTTAGAASGLMGALQLLAASLGIFLSSRLPAGDPYALGWFVLGAAGVGIAAFALFLSLAARGDANGDANGDARGGGEGEGVRPSAPQKTTVARR
ncbi:MFS transporter [Streptomyces sp. Edi4]|uniref:MFS transporter n=1 Tax=Streptomyces sp. Edi4 TaxID=3162527 RepID=UPI0033058DF5